MLKTTKKDPSNGVTPGAPVKTEDTHLSKITIYKNLVILSISWWMLFSAYDGLVMLQSTLNSKKGIGVISVSVQYAFACLSAVLFPKYFIKKLGCKIVIIACMVSHAPFVASNFYPHWLLMIPSSILLGAANPLIWSAVCSYLNHLSRLYSEHIQKSLNQVTESTKSKIECDCDTPESCLCDDFDERHNGYVPSKGIINSKSKTDNFDDKGLDEDLNDPKYYVSKILENTTARFFGFHGTIYTLNIVTSNITSYYILQIGAVNNKNVTNSTCTCGSEFCNNQVACFDSNLKPPVDEIRNILISVFVCLVVLSVILVFLFLNDIDKKREPVSLSLECLMATCRLVKQSNMFFLIPLTIYIGIAQGFFMGDYTQAYVGCTWGIQNVGLVNATFGLALALSSLSSGWFVKYVGRLPIFLFSASLNIATIAILLLWRPDGERPAMLFVVSAFFGVFVSTYWTQIRAFIGILFETEAEAAFGNYQLWHSVGVCIAFGYSKYICTSVKIYILLTISTLAILGYLVVERSHQMSKKENILSIRGLIDTRKSIE